MNDGFIKHENLDTYAAGIRKRAMTAQVVIRGAGDHSDEVLAWAAENYKILKRSWCQCKDQSDIAYFRDSVSGSHGWMCSRCRGLVQTG